jgi:hypothetical protein
VWREEVAGMPGAGGGSLITEIWKPASVNASVIACNDRCQYVSTALWPLKMYSWDYLRVAK